MRPLVSVLAVLALAVTARADDAPAADTEAAKKVVTAYVDAVKAKKWDAARKELHLKRLEDFADQKKRLGVVNHTLAPWAKLSEYYLTKADVGEAVESARGSVVVSVTEENFSVEDNGVEEGVAVEYFLVPVEGRYVIVDRRRGSRQFPKDKVEASYKGWFEGEFEVKPPPVFVDDKPAKPAKKGKGK